MRIEFDRGGGARVVWIRRGIKFGSPVDEVFAFLWVKYGAWCPDHACRCILDYDETFVCPCDQVVDSQTKTPREPVR
jgi:hypothetical protein